MNNDTIFAIASGAGRAAIAVPHLSGPPQKPGEKSRGLAGADRGRQGPVGSRTFARWNKVGAGRAA